MTFPLLAALALTLLTVPVVLVLSVVQLVRRRPQRALWRRAGWLHLGLFAVHLFATFPLTLGYLGSRVMVGTRPPDRPYAGPRLGPDGDLLIQTTRTLRAEAREGVQVDPAILAGVAKRTHTVASSDDVTVRLFRVEPRAGTRTRAVAVLVHGMFRCGVELEPVTEMLRELGCECWLLELRNHGGSSRAPFTGGIGESDVVVAGVEYVRAQPGNDGRPLVLYGVSLGTVAIALALPRIDGVAAVALDSPIDDLHAAAHRMLSFERPGDRRSMFAMTEPWRSLIIGSLGAWSGFRLRDVCPSDVLATLPPDLPMLLIGGGRDNRAPAVTVERMYERLPMPAALKDLWIEADGEHGGMIDSHTAEYRRRLAALLDRMRR